MNNLLTEKELRIKLGASRKAIYFWRLLGMPYVTLSSGIYRYMYDLKAVKKWCKETNRRVK